VEVEIIPYTGRRGKPVGPFISLKEVIRMAKILSVDAEVNGLYGQAFAVAAIVREDGKEIAQFVGRCPIEGKVDGWVANSVLPSLEDMEVNFSSVEELEEAFWSFFRLNTDGATVIVHIGSPVESGLFRRCVERRLEERAFQGPYPLHEVGTLLLALGEDPSSVDKYNLKYGLGVPFSGTTHHPMYDAIAAVVAWEHAIKRLAG
jgi:hypothetical protein